MKACWYTIQGNCHCLELTCDDGLQVQLSEAATSLEEAQSSLQQHGQEYQHLQSRHNVQTGALTEAEANVQQRNADVLKLQTQLADTTATKQQTAASLDEKVKLVELLTTQLAEGQAEAEAEQVCTCWLLDELMNDSDTRNLTFHVQSCLTKHAINMHLGLLEVRPTKSLLTQHLECMPHSSSDGMTGMTSQDKTVVCNAHHASVSFALRVCLWTDIMLCSRHSLKAS